MRGDPKAAVKARGERDIRGVMNCYVLTTAGGLGVTFPLSYIHCAVPTAALHGDMGRDITTVMHRAIRAAAGGPGPNIYPVIHHSAPAAAGCFGCDISTVITRDGPAATGDRVTRRQGSTWRVHLRGCCNDEA